MISTLDKKKQIKQGEEDQNGEGRGGLKQRIQDGLIAGSSEQDLKGEVQLSEVIQAERMASTDRKVPRPF